MSHNKNPIDDILEITPGDDLIDSSSQIWEVVDVLPFADEVLLKRKFGKKKKINVSGQELRSFYRIVKDQDVD